MKGVPVPPNESKEGHVDQDARDLSAPLPRSTPPTESKQGTASKEATQPQTDPDPPAAEAAVEPVHAKKKAKKKKVSRLADDEDEFLEAAMRQAELEKETLEREKIAQKQCQKQEAARIKKELAAKLAAAQAPIWDGERAAS